MGKKPKPPDGLKLPEITHCRFCHPANPNTARIAFVESKPDNEGITWAYYCCLDCAMKPEFGKQLWKQSLIPYTIGR
jgi:hypothetical protein